MIKIRSIVIALALAAALVVSAVAHAETPVVKRFALVVGSNDGGKDRIALRYAGSDARDLAGVLKELGGVADSDLVLLVEPNAAGVRAGFEKIREALKGAGAATRLELVFYYSGHSDEEGILPSGQRIAYSELRDILAGMPAGVRIAIVNSCASGALTRGKGGKRLAPFLTDQSVEVSGHAFLTSSSADEVAQESDKITASFFTHFLVSGLRGGADVNRDGRVTLTEVYQFAFDETLARTQKTNSGPQHANYDIQLAGTGDLVITDLRSTSSGIVIDGDVEGRVFIHDADGRLTAELRKPADTAVELGLPPGKYRLVVETEGATLEASVFVDANADAHVARSDLHKTAREATAGRGDTLDRDAGPWDHVVPFSLVIFPGLSTSSSDNSLHYFNLSLIAGRSAWVRGVDIAGALAWVDHDMEGLQMAGGMTLALRDLRGFQIAGGMNYVGRNVNGSQIAGGLNLIEGSVRGFQIAGGVNLAQERARGFQIAGGMNYAGTLDGMQIAVVNVGGLVNGTQIGVVNIARRVRGAQIGVVNISDTMDGLPVGVLSLMRHGRLNLDLWQTERGTNLGVKLGGLRGYSLMAIGVDSATSGPMDSIADEPSDFTGTFGFGIHLSLPDAAQFVDVDASTTTSPWEGDFLLTTLRGVLGIPVGPLKVLVGASFNVGVAWNGYEQPLLVDSFGRSYTNGTTSVRLYPGFILGLEI